MKKPRPSPAGLKKSLYAAVSRTRKLFGSLAQGGPNKFGAPHTGRLIETEHDNPKELRTVRNSRALNAMPIAFAAYFRQFNLVAHAATAAIHLTLADRTAHDCVPFHNCRGVRPWPEKGTVKRPGNYRRRGSRHVADDLNSEKCAFEPASRSWGSSPGCIVSRSGSCSQLCPWQPRVLQGSSRI